jgi:DNA repair protein RecO (recombination protein O)
MDERTTGLILRTRPLTETSVIVHWLTPDLGRLSTVAKGARRPKSPFRGKLDLFYFADFSFARSRHSELHTLREVVLRETHSALRQTSRASDKPATAARLSSKRRKRRRPFRKYLTLRLS